MANGGAGTGRGRSSRHGLPYEERRRATIAELLADALLPEPGNSFVGYLSVSDALAARVRAATGVDVAGYRHHVDEDHVRHVRELQGPQGRADQTVSDFAWDLLPPIMAESDAIERVAPDARDPGDRGGLNFRKQLASAPNVVNWRWRR